MSNFHLLFQYFQQRKSVFFGIFIAGIFTNLLTIIIPVSVGKYYDLEFGHHSQRSDILGLLPDYFINNTIGFLIFFTLIIVLRFIFYIIYQYLLKSNGDRFIKLIKDKLFEHQLQVEYEVYRQKGFSKYLLRYSGDMTSAKTLFVSGTVSVIIDLIIAIFAFVWLIYLDFYGGIAVLFSTILFYVILYLINKKIEFYSIEKRNASSGLLAFVNRTFHSIISVVAFNKEVTENQKFQKRTSQVLAYGLKFNLWDSLNKGLIAFMQFGALLIVFLIFHYAQDAAQKTPGELIGFILLYITILPVLSRLYRVETIYRMGMISLNKINKILLLPTYDNEKGRQLNSNEFILEAKKLSINKSDKINFLLADESIDLVLPTNVKSIDFIKVLLCLSEDYKGKIILNGKAMHSFSSKSIRKQMVAVSTQLPLVGNVLLEAISYSRNDKSKAIAEETIHQIQEIYNINLPTDSTYNIGENGKNLSPVQLEAFVLIRALLTNKKIVIVDQLPYLSALDPLKIRTILSERNCKVIFLSQ